MEKYLVSIGIPAYNKPKGLQNTLECLTKQSYKNIEIIVSNDGSPKKEIEKIALEYRAKDSRVKYYHHKTNKGGFFNFNYVLQKASGKYFMWAADDDEWDQNYIKKCVEVLTNYSNYGLVFTRFTITSNIDKKKVYLNHNKYLNSKFKRPLFLLLDECLTHKANMLYGVWDRSIASQVFNEASNRGLTQKHMGYGFDNAILTLTLEFTNVYQLQEVLFNKKYLDRIIPGSRASFYQAFIKNINNFINNPIRYIKITVSDSKLYIETIRNILNNPKDMWWSIVLNLKRLLFIFYRHIL